MPSKQRNQFCSWFCHLLCTRLHGIWAEHRYIKGGRVRWESKNCHEYRYEWMKKLHELSKCPEHIYVQKILRFWNDQIMIWSDEALWPLFMQVLAWRSLLTLVQWPWCLFHRSGLYSFSLWSSYWDSTARYLPFFQELREIREEKKHVFVSWIKTLKWRMNLNIKFKIL